MNNKLRFSIYWLFLIIFPVCPSPAEYSDPETLLIRLQTNTDFYHQTGQTSHRGIRVDYRNDHPGYIATKLNSPLYLEPGAYRAVFHLRRGRYYRKGLFKKAAPIFRLELWDLTRQVAFHKREIQVADFPEPGDFEKRWIDFSIRGREGSPVEPRIYWTGLSNGEAGEIEIIKYALPTDLSLAEKADLFGKRMENEFLENGFVVSRSTSGEIDDIGDATTFTAFYAASLAWKYAVKKDPVNEQSLENALVTLHSAIKGNGEYPIITRYLDREGNPHPKSPSKDVYTSVFLAYGTAYPLLKNNSLKRVIETDIERITNRLLIDDWQVHSGDRPHFGLTGYVTKNELEEGLNRLFSDPEDYKKFMRNLKKGAGFLPWGEPFEGYKQLVRDFEKKDTAKIMESAVPTLNALADLVERVRDILKEQYREDLFLRRISTRQLPGKKLEDFLTDFLTKFPKGPSGKRFTHISDLKMRSSDAVLALLLAKTASLVTREPQYTEYYRQNLYTQDALLKTVRDWLAVDDDLFRLTAGNPVADQNRKGYLSTLALYNLAQTESNPTIKEQYELMIKRVWEQNQYEDNPLMMTIALIALEDNEPVDLLRRDLGFYSEDRRGWGHEYWNKKGKEIAETYGSREINKFSMEALPVHLRPKDSFLWQRSPRRLSGDSVKEYPPLDYLFVYWMARYHGLLPAPPPTPTVKKDSLKR